MSEPEESAHQRLAEDIVSCLLNAYFGKRAPDRMVEEVLYRAVPLGGLERNYTVRLFLKPTALIAPAIMLKGKGPSYLASHSMNNIMEMLRKFVYRRFPIIWKEMITEEFDGSLYEIVSDDCRSIFIDALKTSTIFKPRMEYIAFPITPLIVNEDFECENFSLIDVHSLTNGNADSLCKEYLGDKEVGGWLITKAASVEAAKRERCVVLGALALAMDQQHRHVFTLRKVVSGFLRFPTPHSISTNTSNPHTPPIGSPITIGNLDHTWLNKIPVILSRSSPLSKRHGKALEYYYRAWFMDESDRCFLLFMALDAIFGQGRGGFAVGMKSGIRETLNENIDEKRLDALLGIRNTMLHGGAPHLFASSKYLKYAQQYSSDPSTDTQLLAAKCLRRHIFGDDFRCQDNPDAEVLQRAKAQGLIPSETNFNSIVSEWP